MENVIKQGYLKKGSGSDNLFSGLIEKMTPRKWYMLVVRSRVPYFEQYERDVDVFSSTPTVSYNLSTCTSISRSMSQNPRTATFVIVMPEALLELTANTRETMIDWCDALERTLKTLGILKQEKEEHVYSFCPAVANLTGHAKEKKEDDEEDESGEMFGAVGGASAPPPVPPPLRQHPPPLPAGHPSTITRSLSEESSDPPLNNLTPPPILSTPTPSLRRSGSPTSLQPPTECAPPPPLLHTKAVPSEHAPPPPPPHNKALQPSHRPPLPPPPGKAAASTTLPPAPAPHAKALPSHHLPPPPSVHGKVVPNIPGDMEPPPLPGHSHTGTPPPLPPARPNASSPSTVSQPPPLPPWRPHSIENKPRPPQSSVHRGNSVPAARDGQAQESDEETSDYSSDFVSGAFWEINRKTPVPTARHGILSSSVTSAGGSHSGAADQGSIVSPAMIQELDEGYTDLKTVQIIKKSQTFNSFEKKSDQHASGASMKKSATADVLSSEGASQKGVSEKMVNSTTDHSGMNDGKTGAAGGTASNAQHSTGQAGRGLDTERFSLQTDGEEGTMENFYIPFPVNDSYASPAKKKMTNGTTSDPATEDTSLKTSPTTNSELSNTNRAPSPEIESTTFTNDVLDNTYSPLSEASSFPDASAGLPPLPPRLDSLPARKDDGAQDSDKPLAITSSDKPVFTMSQDPARPVPLPRKNNQPPSPTLPPLPASCVHSSSENPDMSQSSSQNPPSLPPRRCSVKLGDSPVVDAPPVPARKSQSCNHARPQTRPPVQSNGERMNDLNSAFQDEPSEHIPSIRRQHSLSGTEATENHLRQRMRLDRIHSMHSVVSLKQSQAEILKQEMELPGVTVTISPRAGLGIGLVDCAGEVCVVGWNQKDFPSLHGRFHIGDQVISICNYKVTSAAMAHKLLKHPPDDLVEMLVKRTPHAKVLAIRRQAEGENIGIKRNGGTAEILYVDPNGLSAQNGLPLHATSVLSEGRCNWMLTEINSRHLSLFFKDLEIEHRLNAVGREITIVVQPSDYILELKKHLKKLKNYKNLIVS